MESWSIGFGEYWSRPIHPTAKQKSTTLAMSTIDCWNKAKHFHWYAFKSGPSNGRPKTTQILSRWYNKRNDQVFFEEDFYYQPLEGHDGGRSSQWIGGAIRYLYNGGYGRENYKRVQERRYRSISRTQTVSTGNWRCLASTMAKKNWSIYCILIYSNS